MINREPWCWIRANQFFLLWAYQGPELCRESSQCRCQPCDGCDASGCDACGCWWIHRWTSRWTSSCWPRWLRWLPLRSPSGLQSQAVPKHSHRALLAHPCMHPHPRRLRCSDQPLQPLQPPLRCRVMRGEAWLEIGLKTPPNWAARRTGAKKNGFKRILQGSGSARKLRHIFTWQAPHLCHEKRWHRQTMSLHVKAIGFPFFFVCVDVAPLIQLTTRNQLITSWFPVDSRSLDGINMLMICKYINPNRKTSAFSALSLTTTSMCWISGDFGVAKSPKLPEKYSMI